MFWLILLSAGLAAAQATCPKCLLNQVKNDLPKNQDSSVAVARLKTAVAQFRASSQNDPERAEALEMLGMYLRWVHHGNLDDWRSEVQADVNEALRICERQENSDPNLLALALELQADVLGRSEAGLPFWVRAQKIRAAQVSAVQPEISMAPGGSHPTPNSQAVVPPTLKAKVEPQFPDLARHAGLDCSRALISMVISANGVPGQFRLLKGCGYGFDEMAVDAVRRWRFIPASLNGSPVAIAANSEVNSRLLPYENAERSLPAEMSVETKKQIAQLAKAGHGALTVRDYQAAAKDFEEITRLDPKDNYAWHNLGLALLALRQFNKAEAAFRSQIALNAADAWAYNNLGRALAAEGQFPAAIEAYRKQIQIDSGDKNAHLNLARALETQGKWDEALPEAQEAANLTPANAAAWAALGTAQAHLGKPDEGRRSFDRAVDLNDSSANLNLVAYAMAEADFDLERAWQLASGALAVASGQVCNPDKPVEDPSCASKLTHLAAVLDTAGWVLLKQGRTNEAQPFLLSAYGIAPHPAMALHLASLYAKQGKVDTALRFFGIAQLSPALDATENNTVRAQLEKLLNNDLNARLDALPRSELLYGYLPAPKGCPAAPSARSGKVVVLVNSDGKVLGVKPDESDGWTPEQSTQIRRLQLPPLAWPGHAVNSVRTIEVRGHATSCSFLSYVEPPIQDLVPGTPSGNGQPLPYQIASGLLRTRTR